MRLLEIKNEKKKNFFDYTNNTQIPKSRICFLLVTV